MMKGEVRYTEKLAGDESNYRWPVQFDYDTGTLGITQWSDKGQIERVLLSPTQAQELVAFIKGKK